MLTTNCLSTKCCRAPVTQNPKVTADRAFNGFGTNFNNSPEPIYGAQFLPRKFKVAVTVPGDNSVDILTNDIGVVVMCDANGQLQGFNLLVGGGMGRTHRCVLRFCLLCSILFAYRLFLLSGALIITLPVLHVVASCTGGWQQCQKACGEAVALEAASCV